MRRNQQDGLRSLYREMRACGLAVQQMKCVSDLKSSRTIETVVLKLPNHVQKEWLKLAYKIIRGQEPMIVDLIEFVKEQADMANNRYGLIIKRGSNSHNRDISVLKGKFSANYNAPRISYMTISDDTVALRGRYKYHSSSCSELLFRSVTKV